MTQVDGTIRDITSSPVVVPPPHGVKVAINGKWCEVAALAYAVSDLIDKMDGMVGLGDSFFGAINFSELDAFVSVLVAAGAYETARGFVGEWVSFEESEVVEERSADIVELYDMIQMYERQG